ncbi:hypothetical protein Tco_1386093 [Tanacetum coccineum]
MEDGPTPWKGIGDGEGGIVELGLGLWVCVVGRNWNGYWRLVWVLLEYPIDQSPPQEMSIQDMEDLKQQYLDEMKRKFNGRSIKINKKKELRQLEQAANVSTHTPEPSRRFNSIYYDDDDDEENTIPLNEIIFSNFTESDEFIKSSVEDLVPIPSESEDSSDIESECNMPFCDDFTTFSNRLFDSNDDFTSSDDESLSDEDETSILENYDVVIKYFSPSPIPVEDSDSLMEDIDIFLASDDSIPPGIENDDYDSEGDILFLEELLRNDSHSLLKKKSFHFDRYYDPSPPRPPAKPPNDDGIHFDIEPNTGILTAKVVDDISEHYVLMPSILPTHPTRCPVIDTLLLFSSENENKVFFYGILASNEEKSPHLLSHRGFKAYQIISDFSEIPMMIYGRDNPILDVPFLHFYPP